METVESVMSINLHQEIVMHNSPVQDPAGDLMFTNKVSNKGRGRPKGSLNLKTLLMRNLSTDSSTSFGPVKVELPSMKRERGRPKGSFKVIKPVFNVKVESMSGDPSISGGSIVKEEIPIKRGRGRPKGSLNLKTLSAIKVENISETPIKRGRGRPKGSLNLKTLSAIKVENISETSIKRGRGRPKGSLNIKTVSIDDESMSESVSSSEESSIISVWSSMDEIPAKRNVGERKGIFNLKTELKFECEVSAEDAVFSSGGTDNKQPSQKKDQDTAEQTSFVDNVVMKPPDPTIFLSNPLQSSASSGELGRPTEDISQMSVDITCQPDITALGLIVEKGSPWLGPEITVSTQQNGKDDMNLVTSIAGCEGAEMRGSSWTDDNVVDKTNSQLAKQLAESQVLVCTLQSMEQQFRMQLAAVQENLAAEMARADAAEAKLASLGLSFMEEKKRFDINMNPVVEQMVKCFKSEVVKMEQQFLQEKSRADFLECEVQKYISTINSFKLK